MQKKILQRESPVLRKIADNVPVEYIKSAKIQNIIREMTEALESQEDGVAIAAPQIGYSLRIFVVSRRVENIVKKSKKKKSDDLPEENDDSIKSKNDLIFINPVIKKLSKEKKTLEEGCLSVRYLYGEVKRSKQATVEAFDENGNKFVRGGAGLLAQIFQHEIDHLNGILFIDKAKHLEEMPPEVMPAKNNAK